MPSLPHLESAMKFRRLPQERHERRGDNASPEEAGSFIPRPDDALNFTHIPPPPPPPPEALHGRMRPPPSSLTHSLLEV
jgi:hypothetical protein